MKKNVLLTLWLAAPILVVTGLCVLIFAMYRSPDGDVKQRAVGAGANDTGGANALGEWLAGHDPDAVQQLKQDLREGRLTDPYQWPGGVLLRITSNDPSFQPVLLRGGVSDSELSLQFEAVSPGAWTLLIPHEALALSQALFVAPAGSTISREGERWTATAPDGEPIEPLRFEPVKADADRVPTDPIVLDFAFD